MASVAISAQTVLISGAAGVVATTSTSADTITITKGASDSLDLSRLVIRLWSSAGSSVGINIGVSSTYSSKGIGVYSFTFAGSGATYIGGKDFDSARFLTESAQSVIITQSGNCSLNAEAVLLPYGFTA